MKAHLDKHGVFEEAERLMDEDKDIPWWQYRVTTPKTAPLEMRAWWTR